MSGPETCSAAKAMQLLGVCRTRIIQLIHEGKLEGIKERNRWRISRTSIYARVAAMPTPPGAQRKLFFARFFRDLTAREPHIPCHRSGESDHEFVLATASFQMFGTPKAEPYRPEIHAASLEVLKAGRLKDWDGLDSAWGELLGLWHEFEFVAKPLGLPHWTAKQSVQSVIFGGAR